MRRIFDFDQNIFFIRGEDYEEAKSYLKELDTTLKTIRNIVKKLNKKMVSYEKQVDYDVFAASKFDTILF